MSNEANCHECDKCNGEGGEWVEDEFRIPGVGYLLHWRDCFKCHVPEDFEP